MSYPTAVNGQITDSVTQTNVKTLGESPANEMGDLYQTMNQATDEGCGNQEGKALSDSGT